MESDYYHMLSTQDGYEIIMSDEDNREIKSENFLTDSDQSKCEFFEKKVDPLVTTKNEQYKSYCRSANCYEASSSQDFENSRMTAAGELSVESDTLPHESYDTGEVDQYTADLHRPLNFEHKSYFTNCIPPEQTTSGSDRLAAKNQFQVNMSDIEGKNVNFEAEQGPCTMAGLHTLHIATETKATQTNGTMGLTSEEKNIYLQKLKEITNYRPCNPLKSKTVGNDCSHSIHVEAGIDVLNDTKHTIVSDFTHTVNMGLVKRNQAAFDHLDNDSDSSIVRRELKTLEDSLRYFNLYPRLQLLEAILEGVRRGRKKEEDLNMELKRLDKDMLKLSQEHHPDKIQSRGGSEEKVVEAQRVQTALNATRKAIKILSKIFLEDIGVDHKYEFYTKLDVSLLGNEDEIESHVYEVLFKISLISEIKQRHIIAEIRKFLMESQNCIKFYIKDSVEDFKKYFSMAIFRLKQCIRGYDKLLRELEEVEEECRAEKLSNIHSLLRKMRKSCSVQLDHLKELLVVTDLCLEGTFQIFTCPKIVDDYFVYPFVCYINVILMCNVFLRRLNKSRFEKILDKTKTLPVPVYNQQTLFLTPLYYLTSYYFGSKCYLSEVQTLLGSQCHKNCCVDRDSAKERFLDLLLKTKEELINTFKIDDYNENGTNRHIAEELRKCKEMKSEFEHKKKELVKDIAHVKQNTKEMNQLVDKIKSNQEESRNQYQAYLAEMSEFHKKYPHIHEEMNQQSNKIMNDSEERLAEYKECLTKNSEILTRFAYTKQNAMEMNPQLGKTMSDEQERRKEIEACLAGNSELQARFQEYSKKKGETN